MTGLRAHKFASLVTRTIGDQPGTAGGVKSGTVGAACHPKTHSGSVNIEGSPAIRHTDEWYMNNRNTVGKLTYVKNVETFEPTPAILLSQNPESEIDAGRWEAVQSERSDIVSAILGGMERAREEGLPAGSYQVADAGPLRAPQVAPQTAPTTAPSVPNSAPSTTPVNPGPAANDNTRPSNRITRSPAAVRLLNTLGLAAMGWEVGDMAGQWYVGPDGVMGRALGNHLRSQTWGDLGRMQAVTDLPLRWGQTGHIQNANDMLGMKTGQNLDFRTMSPEDLERVLEEPWPDADQMRENWDAVQQKRAGTAEDAEEGEDTRAESGITAETVRVTGEEREEEEECQRTVTVDSARAPQSTQHMIDAWAAGHPSVLTLCKACATANRAASLRGIPTQPGKDRDEYPPAMFLEGGAGASVRHLPYSDNRSAGAQMGNQLRNVPAGCRITITIR